MESGRYAIIEIRNCGATAAYATVIRVGQKATPASQAAEIFVADDNHGEATRGGGGAIWTSLAWTKPNELSVAYASRARVFKRVAAVDGATILFRRTEPMVLPPVQ